MIPRAGAWPGDIGVFKTRESLRAAFLDLMKELPFKEVTVSKIAERALVSRKTFYVHFDNIYDLFCDCLTMVAYAIPYEGPDSAGKRNFHERLFRLTVATFSFLRDNPRFADIALNGCGHSRDFNSYFEKSVHHIGVHIKDTLESTAYDDLPIRETCRCSCSLGPRARAWCTKI
ncbi:MAG: TetR/AcrR family transcriptional regulator [Coriobacteriia bacterium]